MYSSEENRLAATPFPCGHCEPCLLEKAKIMKTRILLESMCYGDSVFATLTYNDESVPRDWSLEKSDLILFIKRLRKAIEPLKIRYYAVGEYGTKSARPHYHMVLFNFPYEKAPIIEDKWQYGFTDVLPLSEQLANYITGYILKDLTCENHAKLNGRDPEFQSSSRQKGGIGYPGIKKIAENYKKSTYRNKTVVRKVMICGKEMILGRYLTDQFCKIAGIDESMKKAELFAYQEKIFNENMKDGIYYVNVVNQEESKRNALLKRNKIFKRKEKL